MGRELRADTDELRVAADYLDMHAAALRDDHGAAHAKLSSAVAGFGPTLSAGALDERIAAWEQETAEHHAELMQHSEGHRVAATRYTTADSGGSAQITAAGAGIDEATRTIDM
jgi:uncharacterized small protein (DUF1192 family)